jgi:pyruvate/2-oxoglutarate dehydrogenase complex dihydrolipoamide acyltransferase (E2) component
MSAILMPQFGETAGEEIKIVRWMKSVGDTVTAGEALIEVETEKSTLVLEAVDSGRLVRIEKKSGDSVRPGETVGYLE